jgi:glycine/D-amino acid oxidase-like deaminating enzyme
MSARDCDIAIIGGGIIGLACAWYLRRAGRDVVVLERDTPGAGASHGNCGTITPSHAPPLPEPGVVRRALKWMLKPDAPLYIRPRFDPALWLWLLKFTARCNPRDHAQATRIRAGLLNASIGALPELLRDADIDCGFERTGLLYVFRDPRYLRAARAPARHSAPSASRRKPGTVRAPSARNRPCGRAWPAASGFRTTPACGPTGWWRGWRRQSRRAGGRDHRAGVRRRSHDRARPHHCAAGRRRSACARARWCSLRAPGRPRCRAARAAAADPARQGLLHDLRAAGRGARPRPGAERTERVRHHLAGRVPHRQHHGVLRL